MLYLFEAFQSGAHRSRGQEKNGRHFCGVCMCPVEDEFFILTDTFSCVS
jgi:hypothetical protein